MQAAGDLTLTARQDASLSGTRVDAGHDLSLIAGGNIDLSAVKDEKITDETELISHGWKRTQTDDETVIGTSLQGGKVTLAAGIAAGTVPDGGHITITGSSITSPTGAITIAAGRDVTLNETTEKHESLVQTHTESSGFFSSTIKDTLNYSLINQVKGSTVSGDTVAITAGRDLTLAGSNLVGTRNVDLTAGNDLDLGTASEITRTKDYSYTKKSGLFGGGGFGFTIGSQSQKLDTATQTVAQIASTVGSTSGQVNILAGKNATITGSDLIGAQGINITAPNITIDAAINTSHTDQTYEFHQSGLTVSLGSSTVTALSNTAGAVKRSGDVSDSRLKALYDYKAYQTGREALKDLKAISQTGLNAAGDWKLTVSVGSTSRKSATTIDETWARGSTLTSGGDINLTATGITDGQTPAIDGDLNLIAATITGRNVNLTAANNLNLQAVANTSTTNYTASGKSSGIGVEINLTQPVAGLFIQAGQTSDNANGNMAGHTNTIVTAQDKLTINVGHNADLIGAQIKGSAVKMNIGGDLNLASWQDIDNYTEHSSSSGGTIGLNLPAVISGSRSKIDSSYASVTSQTGIYAGPGGFDITVGQNTDLKGAVIASEATPDKNKLSTDTLTWSDIQNKAEYSASSVGVNLNTGKDVPKKDQGLTPNIGVTASGDAASTTKSAISPGTIEIRSNPNQDISTLSRDPAGAVNALGKIFDKKTVQEQQELANLFGEEVFKAIGDLGLKEGSPEKAALDAFAGGLMAKLGGGSFASGAAGAGFNQLLINELANIKNPAAMQWASAIVGAAAAKVVGGNAQTGASVAASETKNNDLSHKQQQQKLKELENAKNDEERAAVKDKWDKISDKQDGDPKVQVPGTTVYDKNGNESYINADGTKIEQVTVTLKDQYTFSSDLFSISDYNQGRIFALNPLSAFSTTQDINRHSEDFIQGFNYQNNLLHTFAPTQYISSIVNGVAWGLTDGISGPPTGPLLAPVGPSSPYTISTGPIVGTNQNPNIIYSQSGNNNQTSQQNINSSTSQGASGPSNAKISIDNLPKNPNELVEAGWKDVTPEGMAQNTNSREYLDPETGLKARFDPGRPGANGFEGQDHYHVYNPDGTTKADYYLDANGNPVSKGSKASHIVP